MRKLNADPGSFESYQKELNSLYLEYAHSEFVISNAIEIIFEQVIPFEWHLWIALWRQLLTGSILNPVHQWTKLPVHGSTNLPPTRCIGRIARQCVQTFVAPENELQSGGEYGFHHQRCTQSTRHYIILGWIIHSIAERELFDDLVPFLDLKWLNSLILYSQDGHRIGDVAKSIYKAISLLLQKTTPENIKCVCQTLKVSGGRTFYLSG